MKILKNSLLVAFLINLARAGIKDNTMKCIEKCDTDWATTVAAIEDAGEKGRTEDTFASFHMCVWGTNDKPGTGTPDATVV
jgi:hypothetical protein